MALARRGIALLQPSLVGDRLLLHVLDVERAPASLIGIEVRTWLRQKLREIPRLVDAGIESEPADRIVHVRRIAAQEHAAAPELSRNALVHVIEVEMQVIALGLRHVDAPKPSAHGGS